MVALRHRIDELGTWPRRGLALVLGCVSALAFQPMSLVPALAVGFVGLLWLVHGCSAPMRAFALGWIFGLGHFLVGLNWIGRAFLVHPEQHGILMIPAVIGMAGVLAFYCAVAAWLYRCLMPSRHISVISVMVFAVLWVALEWVRGWAFTGFPWNPAGNIWTVSDAMIQAAAVGGVYFLSLLTVIAFALPALLGEGDDMSARRPYRRWAGVLAVSAAILGGLYGGGSFRLSGSETAYVPDVLLRLVQPNIPQHRKWDSELRRDHIMKQLAASTAAPANGMAPTHVIWAETAVPYVLSREPELMSLLAGAAPADGALVTGAVRSVPPGQGGGPVSFRNSIFALGGDGMILSVYDKAHLVPFGEYVPFRDILPLDRLTAGMGDFTAGPGRQTMVLKELPPFSPLICYEIIFPGEVALDGPARPGWILNLTNDAWYGLSAGPYQHFAMARMRAVEEGLPVVRVANTGISGTIDSYGRTVGTLALGNEGYLDGPLPAPLPPTIFARWGHIPVQVLCCIIFVTGMLMRRLLRER